MSNIFGKLSKLFILSFLLSNTSIIHAHEPWLVTAKQMAQLKLITKPAVFTKVNYFNASVILLVFFIMISWIIFNMIKPEIKMKTASKYKDMALLSLRFGVGSTLLLLSFGLIPRLGIPHFTNATLLAPE